MKTRYSILILMLLLAGCASNTQNSGKRSNEERKLEQQNLTEELVKLQSFLFEGNTAFSEGGKPITITSGPNTVRFSPDIVKSQLPFFGTARTASAGFGGQSGYTFEGKPEEYTIESSKKGYKLKAVVREGNESYTLNMSIGNDGNANLSVFSINRSSMRYNGVIRKPEETK